MTHNFKGMLAGEALMGEGSKAALIGNTQPFAVLGPSLPSKSAMPVLNKVTIKGALQAECMAIKVPAFRHFGSTSDLYTVHMNLKLQCEKKLLKSYLQSLKPENIGNKWGKEKGEYGHGAPGEF